MNFAFLNESMNNRYIDNKYMTIEKSDDYELLNDENILFITLEDQLLKECEKDIITEESLIDTLKIIDDINQINKQGENGLMILCKNKNIKIELLKVMFENNLDKDLIQKISDENEYDYSKPKNYKISINNSCFFNYKTALMYLCENENINADILVYFLNIDKNLLINQRDYEGKTALFYLCLNKNITKELIEIMIENGANINIKTINGKNILNYLYMKANIDSELINYLREKYEIDINTKFNLNFGEIVSYIKNSFNHIYDQEYLTKIQTDHLINIEETNLFDHSNNYTIITTLICNDNINITEKCKLLKEIKIYMNDFTDELKCLEKIFNNDKYIKEIIEILSI